MSISKIFNDEEESKSVGYNQYFNICITVLEARNLAWPNMASVVCIKVGGNLKYTKVHKHSDRPFYNEYFVFDYFTTLDQLLNENIIFTVYKPGGKVKFRSRLGSARLDVGTVWLQDDHELKNKWFALTNPNDPSSQVQGFLKCDITIKSNLGKPHTRPVHVQDAESSIERNLFVPEDIFLGRHKACYSIFVYRGHELDIKPLNKQSGSEKVEDSQDTYVEISFAGLSCRTTNRKFSKSPEWNEQLTFTEAYPPLYQNLRIDVFSGKRKIASRYINITNISGNETHGCLPSFGPSFMHLYSTENIYRGSLLIAIETKTVPVYKQGEYIQGVTREKTAPLKEDMYWKMKEFLCFAVVYDISMLDSKSVSKKGFTVSLCFGSNENKMTTTEYQAEDSYCNYNWLNFGEKKPCLFLKTSLPDTRHRLFLSNIFLTMAQSLREQIKSVRDLASDGFVLEANELLDKILKKFKKEYVAESIKFPVGLTNLDRNRVNALSSKMDEIVRNIEVYEQVAFEEKFLTAVTCVKNLLQSVSDPQDSMPTIQFSLWSEDILIGNCNVSPQDIIHSLENKRKGIYCGKLSTHEFKSQSTNSFCGLVELYLWLGTWKDVSQCLHLLPKGHQDLTQITNLPLYLIYSKLQEFVCCCHMYQGRLEPGSTRDDLPNSFVKVYTHNNCAQTKVKSSTLNPIWSETLILPIYVYPNVEYIKMNPPGIIMEVWHEGRKGLIFFGRSKIQPIVKMYYSDEDDKEAFEWFEIVKDRKTSGSILARFEMIEKSKLLKGKLGTEISNNMVQRGHSITIPAFLSPTMVLYRLEIQFWGIREKFHQFLFKSLNKVLVTLSCGEFNVTSQELSKDTTFFNFNDPLFITCMELPEVKKYSPSLIIRVMNMRSLGSLTYIGTHVIRDIHKYSLKLPTVKEWSQLYSYQNPLIQRLVGSSTLEDEEELSEKTSILWKEESEMRSKGDSIAETKKKVVYFKVYFHWLINFYNQISKLWKRIFQLVSLRTSILIDNHKYTNIFEENKYDWWTKYIKSRENQVVKKWVHKKKKDEQLFIENNEPEVAPLMIYSNELENQAEFDAFGDVLKTFNITHHKSQSSVKNIFVKLKLALCLYRWPPLEESVTLTGLDPVDGVLKNMVKNVPRRILVRVYAVKAHNLHPADPNNKADPYIELATYSNIVSDSNNYIPKQLNPVFGRCLEVIAMFPQDSVLTVRVKDWDRFTSHDVIGETVIDLENRFYSSHRGTCGLPVKYNLSGYNQWRDNKQPSEILENLCLENNIPLPDYFYDSIVIVNKKFYLMQRERTEGSLTKQKLALLALNNWNQIPVVGKHLVPEHVETRSLFLKEKPGIEQGKLEMWIDMFDLSTGLPPPPINIKPREPEKFELRVVILNTAKVLLVDDAMFVGEKHCDIFVKGWLTSPEEAQNTDIHYMSLNGEGYFNWRFIFPFSYVLSEERIVIQKKGAFDLTASEFKIPARLNLQVWDSERIFANEFIGSLSMELCKIPRGARSWRLCKVQKQVGSAFTLDLFKVRRTRGWWPFLTSDTKSATIAGYVEAELLLLTEAEANRSPAGLGRSEPDALPKPDRPVYKFKIWMAPLNIMKHMICKRHKKNLFICLILFALGLFVFVGVYSIPVFIMKRLFGAK